MALAKIQKTIFKINSNTLPADGATYSIQIEGGGAAVPIYSNEAGTVLKANPGTLGADGLLDFYVAAGKYRIEVTDGGDTQVWDDEPALSPDVLKSGKAELQFETVQDMVNGNPKNKSVSIDFSDYVGHKVITIVNNSTSKKGGAEYIIKTAAQVTADGDVIDGVGGIGGNHWLLGGTSFAAILDVSYGINCHSFGPIKHNTDCVATINAAMQYAKNLIKDGRPIKVTVPYVGIINVSSVSVLFPRNMIVDLGGNIYKLTSAASKYVFSQDDLVTDDFAGANGGIIEIYNFSLNGNAIGGQTRDFAGTDARDMYCGFGAIFFGLRNLKIHDFTVTDTESWGIAYFKCRDVECYEGTFDQDDTRVGLNGDGITGQAERVRLWNLDGYTNDDFCAITTTRATIGGVEIWNDPIEIRVFSVKSIVGTSKNGKWPHFAVGVYPSDNQVVNSVTMHDIKGVWSNGIWRMGNYFEPVGGTAGQIRHISETDLQGFSRTASHGQRLLFKVTAQQLDLNDVRNIVFVDTADNQFLRLEDCILTNLNISDTVYQQAHTPATRKGVIFADADSELKNVNISNFLHGLATTQVADADKFTLIENLGARPKLSLSAVTKGEAEGGNLNITKDDYWVSSTGVLAGDLNINFVENVTLNSANYSVIDQPVAEFHAGHVSYRGAILSGVSVTTPNEANVLSKPVWAKPNQTDSFAPALFVKNTGSASPEAGNFVFKNSTQNIDINNISGSPTDSYVFLTGVSYKVDPALP